MLLKATEGSSAFGRLLGAKMFGLEKKCELMKVRLGPKVMRKSGRAPCSAEIQNTFTSMIGLNYIFCSTIKILCLRLFFLSLQKN